MCTAASKQTHAIYVYMRARTRPFFKYCRRKVTKHRLQIASSACKTNPAITVFALVYRDTPQSSDSAMPALTLNENTCSISCLHSPTEIYFLENHTSPGYTFYSLVTAVCWCFQHIFRCMHFLFLEMAAGNLRGPPLRFDKREDCPVAPPLGASSSPVAWPSFFQSLSLYPSTSPPFSLSLPRSQSPPEAKTNDGDWSRLDCEKRAPGPASNTSLLVTYIPLSRPNQQKHIC